MQRSLKTIGTLGIALCCATALAWESSSGFGSGDAYQGNYNLNPPSAGYSVPAAQTESPAPMPHMYLQTGGLNLHYASSHPVGCNVVGRDSTNSTVQTMIDAWAIEARYRDTAGNSFIMSLPLYSRRASLKRAGSAETERFAAVLPDSFLLSLYLANDLGSEWRRWQLRDTSQVASFSYAPLRDMDTAGADTGQFKIVRAFNRGNAECQSGQYPQAIASFTAVLTQDSTFLAAYFNRAIACGASGDLSRAIQDYSQVLAANPSIGEAYVNRGVVCLTQGQWTSAIRDFERALEIQPRDYLACYNKAVTCESAGRADDAIAAYRAFITCAPVEYYGTIEIAACRAVELSLTLVDSTIAGMGAEAAYDTACQELGRGRYLNAARGFGRYLEKTPAGPLTPDAEYWLGECYLSLGLLARSEQTFTRLLSAYGGQRFNAAAYKLGVIALATGRTEAARAQFQELIRRTPGSVEARRAVFRMQALE